MAEASPCPELDSLQRLALNQASPDEALKVHRHLVRCAICVQTLKSLKDANHMLGAAAAAETPRNNAAHVAALASSLPPPNTFSSGTAVAERSSPNNTAEFLAPPEALDEIGRLGPYRVLQVIGTGGMGMVFLAEDPQLQRKVALKALRPNRIDDGDSRERFLIEARAAAAIEHDHIVTIYQVGEDRGVPFLAMQYLQGENLEDRLHREKKLALPEAVRIIREVADGLGAAHGRGLIHRDIKPSNIWLEAGRGRVKILDFGLARASRNEGQNLTQTGFVMGTAGYMAPEQARAQPLDSRCDLFSLGCVAYEVTTGRTPFPGTDHMSRLMAVALEQPPPPRQLNAEIPPRLGALISCLLSKTPGDRPDSAKLVIDELIHVEREMANGSQPTPNGPTPTSGNSVRRPARRTEQAEAPSPRPDQTAETKKARESGSSVVQQIVAFATFVALAAVVFLAATLLFK